MHAIMSTVRWQQVSNAHVYKTLVLWVLQAYQDLVLVPEWTWSELWGTNYSYYRRQHFFKL